MLSFLVVDFKGYPPVCPCNQVSSFGIEPQVYFGLSLSGLVVPSHGAHSHVLGIMSVFLGLVEHGEHAGIQFVIVPEEVLGHLFVVEHVLGVF